MILLHPLRRAKPSISFSPRFSFRTIGPFSNSRSHILKLSDDKIECVRRLIEENSTTSSIHRSAQLNIAHTTLSNIIHDDLGMYCYRIVSTHRLLTNDCQKRSAYPNFVIEHASADDASWYSIIMTDEAHFSLSGAVNSQNHRYYAE